MITSPNLVRTVFIVGRGFKTSLFFSCFFRVYQFYCMWPDQACLLYISNSGFLSCLFQISIVLQKSISGYWTITNNGELISFKLTSFHAVDMSWTCRNFLILFLLLWLIAYTWTSRMVCFCSHFFCTYSLGL